MSDLPFISVVTPSLNQGRFIERTIQSVVEQRGAPFEYLVMDGGSTDETLDILRRYSGRLQWVSEPDKGQADAVNKGFGEAKGEIFGWLNSDDVYRPGALAVVGRFFRDHPEVEWCYGGGEHIDQEDRIIASYPTEDFRFERLPETCFFCQPAVFLRSRFVSQVGPLNVNLLYSLDYDYWIRAARLSVPEFIPEFLAGSRLHAETKTHQQRRQAHAEIAETVLRHFNRVPLSWVFGLTFFDLTDRLGCPIDGHYGSDWFLDIIKKGWRNCRTWVLLLAFPLFAAWRYLVLNKRGPTCGEWRHGFSRTRYWMGTFWSYVKNLR